MANFNSVLGIGVAVGLVDMFTGPARNIENTFSRLSKSTTATIQNQLTAIRNFGTSLATVSGGVIYGMRHAMLETMKFEEILYKTKAVAGITNDDLEWMKKRAIDLSFQFPNTASEIASGFLEIAKAGITARSEIVEFQKAVLAYAGGADIPIGGEEGATNQMLRIMAGYAMKKSEAMKVADMLAKASNITPIEPKQIYEAFQYSQDVMHNFGVGLAESIALVATAGQAGLVGSRAGIGLSNLHNQLAKSLMSPTGHDKKALAMMGLTPEDLMTANKDLISIDKVMAIIQNRMKGMGSAQRSFIEQNLLGVRGGRMGSDLGRFLFGEDVEGTPAKTFSDVLNQVVNSTGAAMAVISARMASPQQKLQMFSKAWFEFQTAFSDTMIPIVLPILNTLTKVLREISAIAKTPIGGIMVVLGTIGVIGAFVSGISMAFMAMRGLAVLGGGASITKMFGVTGGIITVFQMLWKNMNGLGTFLTGAGLWGGSGMRMMGLWSTQLKNIPILGTAILRPLITMIPWLLRWSGVLGALAIVIYEIYTHSDSFAKWVDNIGQGIASICKSIADFTVFIIKAATSLVFLDLPGFYSAKREWDIARGEILPPKRNTSEYANPANFYVTDAQGNMSLQFDKIVHAIKNNNKKITVQVITPQGKILTTQEVDENHAKALMNATGHK